MQIKVAILPISILPILSLAASVAYGQSSDKVDKSTTPNSISPNKEEREYSPKKTGNGMTLNYENAEQEFQDRMHDLQKTRRKNERLMDKPQYSDPMYFGHKHPPKKHKPSKMKFCKVCGIRH